MEWNKIEAVLRNIILDIKKECIIQNTAIKVNIFGILESNCTVIYYPLPNEKNRGFLGKGTSVKTIPGLRTLLESAESKEKIDEYLLRKIKKDFDIVDMPIAEREIEIRIGDSEDE